VFDRKGQHLPVELADSFVLTAAVVVAVAFRYCLKVLYLADSMLVGPADFLAPAAVGVCVLRVGLVEGTVLAAQAGTVLTVYLTQHL
jgi:hypothetical protein